MNFPEKQITSAKQQQYKDSVASDDKGLVTANGLKWGDIVTTLNNSGVYVITRIDGENNIWVKMLKGGLHLMQAKNYKLVTII